MDLKTLLIALLMAVIVAEVLGACDWVAKRIVTWSGRRWKDREGVDHTREWLEDLENRPGTILKLITAIWLALGTILPADWMTLGLPSLWRIMLPYRESAVDVIDFFTGLVRARITQSGIRGDWLHMLTIRAAVSLLPAHERARYLREWTAELVSMPRNVKTAYCLSLVAGAPRLAIVTRYATRRLK